VSSGSIWRRVGTQPFMVGLGLLVVTACVPQQSGQAPPTGPRSQEVTREALAGDLWQTSQCFDRIENKPEYQALLARSPGVEASNADDAYTDNSTLTPDERRVLQAFVADIQYCRPAVDRFQGTPFERHARGVLTVWNDQQVLYQQLLSGQLTWGVFNKRSAENTSRLGAVMADLSKDGPLVADGSSGAAGGPVNRGTRTTPIVDLTGAAPGAIRPGQASPRGTAAGISGTTTAAASASAPGRFLVHLASYRAQETAEAGWQTLVRTYKPLLDTLRPVTAKISVPGKGEFVRLLAAAFNESGQANRLCQQIKQRGHDFCQVVGTR